MSLLALLSAQSVPYDPPDPPEDTPVTATAPTFTDLDGTTGDVYTIPAKTGVVYKVGGAVTAAGTYPGTGTVTVTAEAAPGYVLTGTTSWSHTFSAATTGGDPPVARSLVSPYHAPAPSTIPTPDGTGSTVHPSAVDMGSRWNGYRYWMANTPYAGQAPAVENPCVWGSNDADTWEVPAGLTNPIYPQPWPGHWADTDLLYDPDTDRLVMAFNDGGNNVIHIVSSSDGTTWPDLSAAVSIQRSTITGQPLLLSPSLVRLPSGAWRLYLSANGGLAFLEAPDWTGPWGSYTVCNGFNGWHSHIMWDEIAGQYRGIATDGTPYYSANGTTWINHSKIVSAGTGWQTGQMYRGCMRVYDANEYHLWYSAIDTTAGNPMTGYTRFPRSHFPT